MPPPDHADLDKRTRDKLARMGAAYDKVDGLLFRLGQQGLQRMTRSSAVELQALGQTAHNAALIRIEREIDLLTHLVQQYLDRDPLFKTGAYLASLNRLWMLNRMSRRRYLAGELPGDMLDINGEARRSYVLLDEPLLLQPLGASGWVSDTDFVGITVYFWAEGDGRRIYQASNAKPTMYFGNDPRRLLSQTISDHVQFSIHDVSHGAFRFDQAKVSRDGRLSLHKDLTVKQAPWFGARAYEAMAARDWVALVEQLRDRAVTPLRGQGPLLAYIEPAAYGEVQIDRKNARATLPLTDGRGAEMTVDIPLRSENNFVIDNLERLQGDLVPDGMFGRAWVGEGTLRFFPFTAIYHQAVTLGTRRGGSRQVHEVHLSLEDLEYVQR